MPGGKPSPSQELELPGETTKSGAAPPALPSEPTFSSSALEDMMVLLHGPAGVGKTTLASQWGGGGGFFFNCSSELQGFELYQVPVPDWETFRQYSWALSLDPDKYPVAVIDTTDALGRYCSEYVRTNLGVTHESQLDWGVGYQALRDTFSVNMAKLAAIPNLGIVMVAHDDPVKVKTRSSEYDRWQIRGVKSVREPMMDMSDLVLMIDFAEEDGGEEYRVIKTKPSRYWDAKERGLNPRLPAEIRWPVGENGWDIIKAAWDEGGK
jgi:hypothetical protein